MKTTFKESLIGETILNIIRQVTLNSYYNLAPEGSLYPLTVFNLTSAFKTEDYKYRFFLEINIWDNRGNNIKELLETVENLQNAIDNCIYDDKNINLRFKLESIITLDEIEHHLRRRQLRFIVNYYQNKE
jgi:hypothetical protein